MSPVSSPFAIPSASASVGSGMFHLFTGKRRNCSTDVTFSMSMSSDRIPVTFGMYTALSSARHCRMMSCVNTSPAIGRYTLTARLARYTGRRYSAAATAAD